MPDSTPRDDLTRPLPPDENTIPPAQDPADQDHVVAPPTSLFGTLRQLGPGLIIAGSIVGSGELIATTKTGAQAGLVLLWLIILGCIIKVFVQIELGRVAITHGVTTLAALNQVPGRIGPANWILWFWLAMMAASIAQLGGIVGGVGQSLALAFPISGDYVEAIQIPSASDLDQYLARDDDFVSAFDLLLLDDESAGRSAETNAYGLLQGQMAPWRAHRTEDARSALATLAPAERNDLLADFQRGFLDPPTADRWTARASLRRRLRALNHARHPASAPASASTAANPSAAADLQVRVERGHEILAEQMTDAAIESGTIRVMQAAVAQSQVRKTRAAAQALPAGSPERDIAALEVQSLREWVRLLTEPWTWDDKYWAAVVTFITVGLLVNGRYEIIQNLSTMLVVLFTFVTIGNVLSLQMTEQWRLSGSQILGGLSFRLPEGAGLKMALATFGIIGVGATELITYPYWCIEKGYARFTGWRSDDPTWAGRARGWMRVMHWDAFLSMVIYTVATIAFYFMGAAVLFQEGRDPDGMRMVSTLSAAYVPVFGEYAKYLFLVGAIAVLYSTFLVANAGHARMFTDGLKVFRLMDPNSQRLHNRALSVLCVLLPLICLAIFWSGINPVEAVAFAGMMQATMLPMIGLGALYWRWTATDPRLAPSLWWDMALVVSFVGLLIVGVYGVWSRFMG